MKIFILLIAFILCSVSLFAQKPTVKIYLSDGTNKSHSLEDISNISFIRSQNNFIMKLFYKGMTTDSIPTQNIDSLTFESGYSLSVYNIASGTKKYDLNKIDSIIFTPLQTFYIASIIPTAGKTGDYITISGNGFGSIQGDNYVSFNGAESYFYSKWTNNEIKVQVPDEATTGKVTVTVNSIKSNGLDFSVIPQITSIDPLSGAVDDIITLSGSGFGSSQVKGKVSFGTISATEYTSWSNTLIEVKVPTGAATCKLSVTASSQKSNEMDFTVVVAPNITSINPTAFVGGDNVTITGTDFGAIQGNSFVSFNITKATTITSWSATKIVCKVPDAATTGKLTVTVNYVKSNLVDYTITSSLAMVLIPAGNFQMGNTGSYSGMMIIPEVPVHQVTISKRFYMSKYEINQALYTSVVGSNPSGHKGDAFPVDRINWYDAVAFCNKLSDRDGYTKCYSINGTNVTCNWSANGYRLPTEAEWEYACKAGTTTDFYNGSNESDLSKIAWHSGNSGDSTHVPGQKVANKWGLYDIIGNVFEWVWDWSGDYTAGSVTDPRGPSAGTLKIIRGGSWHNGMVNGMSRSSFRGWMDTPSLWSSTNGIRVVRTE